MVRFARILFRSVSYFGVNAGSGRTVIIEVVNHPHTLVTNFKADMLLLGLINKISNLFGTFRIKRNKLQITIINNAITLIKIAKIICFHKITLLNNTTHAPALALGLISLRDLCATGATHSARKQTRLRKWGHFASGSDKEYIREAFNE